MLYNKAVLCEYLGTKYFGWQRQPSKNTIQDILEEHLSHIYDSKITIIASGRTDSGVHSFGQVFNFKSSIYRDNSSIFKALNTLLPDDISILKVVDVDIDFTALKSTKSKTYMYKIINCDIKPAFFADRAFWVRREIDINKLKKNLSGIIGTHDFASFCVTKTKLENTIRTINFVNIETLGSEINIFINANGFLHNMVRIICGTALDLTFECSSYNNIQDIVMAKDRKAAGRTLPAKGLYQKEVIYDKDIFSLNLK